METNRLQTLRMLAECFKRYGISAGWLKAEAEAGRIPCFKAGRRLLFDAEAVELALLQRAAVGVTGSDASSSASNGRK